MAFRRGFKSQCERRAVEIRKDLGLATDAPLHASHLAKHLNITVWTVNDVLELPENDRQILISEGDDSWSAFTLRIGPESLVLYKEVSSAPRNNSVIMHELSHILLGHELADAYALEDGSLAPSNYSQDQEDEANWLAGTLLLPRPALVSIRRQNLSDQAAKETYMVSQDMLNWRVRMTGIDYQFYTNRRRA